MLEKFGRETRQSDTQYTDKQIKFEVENYLNYQGEKFSQSFDANTYLLMTYALDYFDPAAQHNGDLAAALAPAKSKFLVISFDTDWRFSSANAKKMVDAMVRAGKHVSYNEIRSTMGHDSFLMAVPGYVRLVGKYLNKLLVEMDAD